MNGLILGGSGSGKSAFAENLAVSLARKGAPLLYIATMAADDSESRRRIARHRRLRAGKGFFTLEKYTRLEEVQLPAGATVLLECLSNLAANEMFSPEGRGKQAAQAMEEGLARLAGQAENLIVVSNDVFGDGTCYPGETEEYRQALAKVNQALADRFPLTVELVHGIPVYWKGGPELACLEKTEKKETLSMKLVTGGAYQGKLAAARMLAGKPEPRIWEGAQGEPADWGQVDVLDHFPELVRRTLQEAGGPASGAGGPEAKENPGTQALEALAERMVRENPSLVVVTREIGCGLVPMDAEERLWREQAGRVSCLLAEQAAEVYRVCCGQIQKIKG